MKVLVSIIMPCFNASKTIKSSLRSVKAQTFKDFECIVIDDNSTDDSLYLIGDIVDQDQRFKIIKLDKNQGVSFSRNVGIASAKGRFITFLDSDDLWDENFISHNLEMRKDNEIPISHSSYIRFKKDKSNKFKAIILRTPNLVNRKNILYKNYLPLLSVFIDRKIVGEFSFRNIRPEDYDLWIELIKNRNFYSKSTDKINCFYRISPSQRSKINSIHF